MQSTYLFKLIRDQTMPRTHFNTVFSKGHFTYKITYAIAWRGFLTVEQFGRINFLS